MAQKQTEDADQIRERYQAFIRNSSEGIWRFELDKPIPTSLPTKEQVKLFYKYGYLAETNLSTAKMYGFRSVNPMIGMRLNEFLVESDPQNTAYLKAFIESGYNLSDVESHELDKKGKDKYFLNSLVGIIEDGSITRAWGTQLDVTNQKIANDEMQQSKERLSMALKATSTGLWEWEVATNKLYWSPELRKIFGVKPNEEMTYEKYIEMIHPEDREHAGQVAMQSMQTGEMYQFEHRIIRRDGSIHWILGKGRAYLEDGKPVRMIGTSMNIDALKQAQELKTANTQLRSEHAELLALNKAKDEFIALASHQLRTPATAVKQYISLLINEFGGPVNEEQIQYLQTAFDSNERQLRIINDLLKTAQLDSSLYALKKQEHDFSKIIRFAIDELESTFQLKRQTVSLKGLQKVEVEVDLNEMKLVLLNLLENASKYSYPSSEIVITMRKSDNNLEVSIADKGVGIKEVDAERIFDKFTRVDNDLSDTVTGTGLGLYWVKRIVGMHGGDITVESQPGKGSTFIVRLPL